MQKKLFMILFGLVLLIPIQFVQADQDYGPPPPESKPVFQAAQHVAGPSDPWENGAIDTPSKIDSFNWQTKPWTFERGDHIVGVIVPVGGFEFEWGIYNEAQFRRALSYADDRIVVKIIDRNTGRICYLLAHLWPKGSQTRLGLYLESVPNGQGAYVTGVMSGSPARRCLHCFGY